MIVQMSYPEEVEKPATLHDQGIISDLAFEAMKGQLPGL
jgi:hypothetical protein